MLLHHTFDIKPSQEIDTRTPLLKSPWELLLFPVCDQKSQWSNCELCTSTLTSSYTITHKLRLVWTKDTKASSLSFGLCFPTAVEAKNLSAFREQG